MKKSLIALAFGTLALGMAEFVMMGILPDVARDLGVSIPRAGDLISAYAVGVCVGAPATVLIARKRALKGILLALAALIVLGNVCASLAPDFWMLLAMRFVSGLPHGAFFGVGSIVAERVADPGHKTQAVSIMILGMTVANLFCVPLGTYLGSYLSWRLAFGMVGLWGIMALLLIARWVPALPALPDTGLKGQFRFLGSRAPWLILLATLLANGGVFCWYSYVTPTMTRVAGIPGQAMTAVMMVAGLGMLVAPLLRKAISSKILISKRNRDFLFSDGTQKTAEYYRSRCSNRWSKKGGARISTEQDCFSLICNILRVEKACMVSYFCPTKKL